MNSIDHAAEAQKWIDYSADLNPEIDGPRIAHASVLAASHAALAGVEQQRIANLIAWTTRSGGTPLPEVADVIAEGLGL